ncbi:hypothetical protein H0H92_000991, partial [Tricholoma furcatifolium]
MEAHSTFGAWLRRRFLHTQAKKAKAEELLRLSGKPVAYLREQWRAQIAAQKKPLPRQSRQASRNAVTELMHLRETRDEVKAQIHELTASLAAELDMLLHDHAEMMMDLRELKNCLKELQATIRRKESVLGVDDRAKLQTL